jgi:hypothetical protein
VAEQAIPLAPAVTEVLALRPLIAAGNAARVALGGLHLGSSLVELLLVSFPGALRPPAPSPLAVRRHRSSSSSSKSAFSPAYHLATE